MSDQGYGNQGWNSPDGPQYGGQSGYGQYPNQYGQDQYGQPSYGNDQYQQGGYGQPPYGNDQYQQGGYGQPYGAPPPAGKSQKGIFIGLGAVVVAGLVVLVLAVTGVFSGSSTKSDSPSAAVENLLAASKNQNLSDVKALVCQKDLSAADELDEVVGTDHAVTYKIGAVKNKTATTATVTATVTTTSKTTTDDLPVVKEGGKWKVCFSDALDPTPDPTDSPSTSDPSSTSDFPSTLTPTTPPAPSTRVTAPPTDNLCISASDANGAAKLFISGITLGDVGLAQGCVYPGALSAAQVQALIGSDRKYNPYDIADQKGPNFTIRSSTGSHTLRFTVQQKSDGHFYVVTATSS